MSKLTSGVAKLMAGRGAAMAISFATAPVWARLYQKEHYGVAVLIQSIVVWIAPLAGLAYSQAIPLASSRDHVRQLVRLTLMLTGLFVLPVLVFSLGMSSRLAALLNEPQLARFAYFIPVLLVLTALRQLSTFVLSKHRRFGLLSFTEFTDTAVARFVQLVLAWFLGGATVFLLVGSVVGGVLAIMLPVTLVIIPLVARRPADGEDANASMAEVAHTYRQFPRVQVWSQLLSSTSNHFPALMLGVFYASEVVGLYGMGLRMVTLPLIILGASLGQTFYPEAADEWQQHGRISQTVHATVRLIAVLCVFPVVCLALLGPPLFEVFLGQQWREAGVYAQILAPWLLVMLVNSPVATVFLVRKLAHISLLYQVALMVGRIGVLALGGALAGPRVALAGFSAVGCIVLLHRLNYTFKLAKASRRLAAGLLAKEALYAGLALAPPAAVYWLGAPAFLQNAVVRMLPAFITSRADGTTLSTLMLLGLSGVVHAVLLYRREPAIRQRLRGLYTRVFAAQTTIEADERT